ncbi:MAG TPA: hypothetical protein VHZ73_06280 [Vicinamibacterales bacterium]|jgi:hypothetical protein|nr:hypothetical protein [Vicinamibacterales bacterium]
MKPIRNIFVAAMIAAAATVAVVHADMWSDLGTQESEARQQTLNTVLHGYLPSLGATAFKAATPAARSAMVQKVAAWAKTFIQSPAFKTAYDKAREDAKPRPPAASGSYADQLKKQREDFDKTIAEMRKSAAGQSQQVRDSIEAVIKQTQAQFDEMSKNTDLMKTMEQATAQSAAAAKVEYTQSAQAFDKEHPASINQAIALRLHRFLDTCGAVDFNAQIVAKGGTKVFVNPAYEANDDDWKMCFRAGKEPVDAAKALAQAWLREIGG